MTPTQTLEYRAVGALVPSARNARTHTAKQLAQIVALVREYGWTNPVLADAEGIVAGHGRVLAAAELYARGEVIRLPSGEALPAGTVPVLDCTGWSTTQRRAYVIADNAVALQAGWDESLLRLELAELSAEGFDLGLLALDADDLAALTADPGASSQHDTIPELQAREVTRFGDVWELGAHRVMCGDSTSPVDLAALMDGQTAVLVHADPPYGMGKAAEGVANDNLYREKLDRFQLAWWQAARPHLDANASAYVWGNAPDLWRLWFRGGLEASELLELRNEIVWDKKSAPGLATEERTMFTPCSERCLFFQFGNQFLGHVNTDDFPETWEPLRAYLHGQAQAAGITPPDVRRVCGCGMYSHWFTRAQFTLMPERHHATLRAAYPGHFARPWPELKAEWDRVKGFGRSVLHDKLDGVRSYFDNAHDVMRDVWEFPRVMGEDRYGHATPKPVAMMERVMRSSVPEGGLCLEPFGGTGSTLIGAQLTGRRCFTMELQPLYVDVIVRRWQTLTGEAATCQGQPFDERAAALEQVPEAQAV